jgi:hypothetical protein
VQEGQATTNDSQLELTIKINELPANAPRLRIGWKSFEIDCDGQIIPVTVASKVSEKLEDAQAKPDAAAAGLPEDGADRKGILKAGRS